MSDDQSWIFDDQELPNWARAAKPQPIAPTFSWRTIPAPTPLTPSTFLVRSLVWRVVLVAFLTASIICGAKLQTFAALAAATGTALVGGLYFAIVTIIVVTARRNRYWAAESMGIDTGLPDSPWYVPIIAFPAMAALFVLLSAVTYRLFPQPFTAVLILAPLALFLQVRLARNVFAFARERLSIDEWLSREERARLSAAPVKPDLLPMIIFLAVTLLVPAFFSTTAGILALTGGLVFFLAERFRAVQRHGPFHRVLAALLIRAERTITEYCDYQPTEEFHWRPRRSRTIRFWSFLTATWALDIVFLVGLCGFFPWELAAGLTVPGYDLPGALLTHYQTGRYQWILTPLELMTKADPPGLYLACLAITLPLFVLATPAALLATYMPELIDLENEAQKVKRAARSQ